jgi:hypothetical protein
MSDKKGKTHHSEKRFGVVAVEQGLITRDQLYEGLKAQVEGDLDGGPHQPLGEILVQQGTMRWAQIVAVFDTLAVLEKALKP